MPCNFSTACRPRFPVTSLKGYEIRHCFSYAGIEPYTPYGLSALSQLTNPSILGRYVFSRPSTQMTCSGRFQEVKREWVDCVP